MKYFKLEIDIINKIVGSLASESMDENYMYQESNSVYNLNQRGKLDFIPNLNSILVSNKAKCYDIIRSVPVSRAGMLISDKLLNVFKEFLLPKELQIFDALAIHKGREYHYNYFYIYEANEASIFDFENNYFIKTNFGFPEDDYFKIDYKELKKRSLENYEELTPKEIIVKPENITSDIFRLDLTMSGYYVSQRLKEAIEKAECKGLKFIPIEELKYKHK